MGAALRASGRRQGDTLGVILRCNLLKMEVGKTDPDPLVCTETITKRKRVMYYHDSKRYVVMPGGSGDR